MINYKNKYLKYKLKYLKLTGGMESNHDSLARIKTDDIVLPINRTYSEPGFNVVDNNELYIRTISAGRWNTNDINKRLTDGFNVEIEQLFTAMFYRDFVSNQHTGSGSVELVGAPATLILPNKANVTIAGQIFMRKYTENKDYYKDIKSLKDYYIRLSQTAEHELEDYKDITWLGFPSFIYSFNNRKKINHILNNRWSEYIKGSCISLIASTTSFDTTTIISKIGNKEKETEQWLTVPEKIRYMRDESHNFKNQDDKSVWQHRTLTRKPSRVTTNPNQLEQLILNEQKSMNNVKKLVCNSNDKGLLRYNEIWSWFYPWDIYGIEVGLIDPNLCNKLLNELKFKFNEFHENFRLTPINDKLIDISFDSEQYKHLPSHILPPCHVIFLKFIRECFPNESIINIFNSNRILFRNYLEDLKDALLEVMNDVSSNFKLYEYGRNNNEEYFNLREIKSVSRNEEGDIIMNKRTSPYELFEQQKDKQSNITFVYKSDKQLDDYMDI